MYLSTSNKLLKEKKPVYICLPLNLKIVKFSKDVKTISEGVILNISACNIPPQTTENVTFILLLFYAHIKTGY